MRLACAAVCASLLAGCAGRAEPAMVEIAAPRAPSSAEPQAPAEPAKPQTTSQALARLNTLLREASAGGTSIALEAGGRVVKRDATDAYEEDFHVADVEGVAYEEEPGWTVPHVARVKIKPGGETRFRRGDEAWTISTIPHVSFAFRHKRAADEAVEALRTLLRR